MVPFPLTCGGGRHATPPSEPVSLATLHPSTPESPDPFTGNDLVPFFWTTGGGPPRTPPKNGAIPVHPHTPPSLSLWLRNRIGIPASPVLPHVLHSPLPPSPTQDVFRPPTQLPAFDIPALGPELFSVPDAGTEPQNIQAHHQEEEEEEGENGHRVQGLHGCSPARIHEISIQAIHDFSGALHQAIESLWRNAEAQREIHQQEDVSRSLPEHQPHQGGHVPVPPPTPPPAADEPLPQHHNEDCAVSAEDKALLDSVREKIMGLSMEKCNGCHEQWFDLGVKNGLCSKCQKNKKFQPSNCMYPGPDVPNLPELSQMEEMLISLSMHYSKSGRFMAHHVTVDSDLLQQVPEDGSVFDCVCNITTETMSESFEEGPPEADEPDQQNAAPLFSHGFVPNVHTANTELEELHAAAFHNDQPIILTMPEVWMKMLRVLNLRFAWLKGHMLC
ncbi:hypothetical protein GLOTRDRAFT_96443 [Gloeophyllum trabeum ATCC 11539]|uniref:Uncharacterized protein n=1 Tax=Gloeophyllum trabeum (strain ATCC 11539 / FP-39264 / Madison 617) TaxID=670483 RepID=S7RAG1_GLOTA|nr:uncharacterized protein GLOTRDRAFT_96443 [Gloeophyllum trabeum ATCC 11539]EPQ51245.1 hypothetical protein GLOTRDRAFT_96443 [Gloeophyllum trabeum ATCC 11539]